MTIKKYVCSVLSCGAYFGLICSTVVQAAPTTIELSSPDGENVLLIRSDQGATTLAIAARGKPVITASAIDLSVDGNSIASATASETQRQSIQQTIIPVVPGHSNTLEEHYNEVEIKFSDIAYLRARAYNEGLAYRWEINSPNQEVIIDHETLQLQFAEDYSTYFTQPNGEAFFSHQESEYPLLKISETANAKLASTPVLKNTCNESHLLVFDVNVENYPGLWLQGSGQPQLRATFPPYPLQTKLEGDRHLKVSQTADFIARTPGKWQFPWRGFMLDDSAGLLTNALPYLLAEPSRIEDPSWIKPGVVAWDWWNDNNIYGVPFRAGINTPTYQYFIDFAAEMNARYVILDEGWSVKGPDNLLSVVPDIDIPKLVAHGRQQGVDLILWMTSTALERNFEAAFRQFAKWGIKGIKVDFMQRDDQPMMEFMYRIAEHAAQHQILVDFHGGSKPTGLHRTWPNVLTFESVLGLEQSKWGDTANPELAVTLPFTRMVVGPMDYTPGGMINLQKRSFKPMFTTPATQGTRAQQLAMYVVYLSPLQMLADTPTNYRRNPESLPFLQQVPTVWDETRVLEAEVGEQILIARRHGARWFIGGMTNWSARDLECALDFLGMGEYTLTSWSDGPNADRNGNDVAIGTRTVTAADTLSIHLAPGGGYAAILERR